MYMDNKPRVQPFACCLKHWKTWIMMYFLVRGSVRDIQGSGIFGATIFDIVGILKVALWVNLKKENSKH